MKRSLLATALLAASLASSCGGGSGPGNPDGGQDVFVIDYGDPSDASQDLAGRDSDDPDGNCRPVLGYAEGMDDPANGYHIVLSFNADRTMKVKVTACNAVAADVPVFFVEEQDEKDICKLDVDYTTSSKSGIAAVQLRSPQSEQTGDCRYKACLDLDQPDTCILFNVQVSAKGMPPLVVGFEPYTGAYPLVALADVMLYRFDDDSKPDCSQINLDKLDTAQATGPGKVSLLTTVPFMKEQLKNLESDQNQVYTVLCRAYEEGSTTARAYGCVDDVHVELGGHTYVDCPLQDIPPKIVGTYDITSTFDMVTGLPDNVQQVVYYIIDFFSSPTATVLKLMCDPKIWSGSSPLESVCEWIFATPTQPDIELLTGAGEIVKTIVDSLLIGLLQDQCPGNDPNLCKNIYFTGGDVAQILKNFTIKSRMTCTKEPDKNGLIALGGCTERWHTIVLQWSLGKDCQGQPDCGLMLLSLDSLQGSSDTVTADIEAQLVDKNTKLAIMPHHITLMYGIIVDYLLEKQLLPTIFGNGSDGLPPVDSFESMIGALLAGRACLSGMTCCAEFAANVSGQVGGLATNLIEGACDALIQTGADYVRKFLTDLSAEPDNFTLQTPDDQPCAIFDTNKDMKFDALGKQPEDQQCAWKAHLVLGSYDFDPDGRFYGLRK